MRFIHEGTACMPYYINFNVDFHFLYQEFLSCNLMYTIFSEQCKDAIYETSVCTWSDMSKY